MDNIKEITFSNGAEGKVTVAPFLDSISLKSSIQKAILKQGIKIADLDLDVNSLQKGDLDLSYADKVIEALLVVDSDEEVRKNL